MKLKILVLVFLCMGCRIKAIFSQRGKFLYTIEVKNTSGVDLVLHSYFKDIKYDTIIIDAGKTFKKEILFEREKLPNYHIWSDNIRGSRDKIIIIFKNKKSLNTVDIPRFEWFYRYHSTLKPRRGFSWYNPNTETWNYGTFKYCITKEDYNEAISI